MERLTFNEWTVSGEVFYLKELEGEFSASVKVRGVAKRAGVYSSQPLEFSCLMQENVYKQALRKGFAKYRNVTISGHLETWVKQGKNNEWQKVMFIADDILEVK